MKIQSERVLNDESDNNHPLRGEVVYIYAYDIAHDMKRQRIQELLCQPVSKQSLILVAKEIT